MTAQRLYWLGNVAKSRVIDDILQNRELNKTITIFDYGCGDGGDWPTILQDYSHLRLVGYEPYIPSYKKALARLRGHKAIIHTGKELEVLDLQADFIVSFSVFEHVVQRSAFLSYAKRNLAPEGTFFLNYDDGHFRNLLDISQPTSWLPALQSYLRTIVSPVMAAVGLQSHYQRRVVACEVDTLVREVGFSVERIDYHNLLCFKQFFKSLPEVIQQQYVKWWLDNEKHMNTHFLVQASKYVYGDPVNLWQHMVSRTLCLRHADSDYINK